MSNSHLSTSALVGRNIHTEILFLDSPSEDDEDHEKMLRIHWKVDVCTVKAYKELIKPEEHVNEHFADDEWRQ